MAFIMYGDFMKTVAAGTDVKLLSTGAIYFHTAQYLPWLGYSPRQYLSWHSACLYF